MALHPRKNYNKNSFEELAELREPITNTPQGRAQPSMYFFIDIFDYLLSMILI